MTPRRSILALTLVISTAYFLFHANTLLPFSLHSSRHPLKRSLVPANATLGFGTILAVSHRQSPRRPALLWAANLTGLQITVPELPEWTDAELETFRAKDESTISKGSALAWLGHLHVLRG